jgi:hypothetical protein
MIKLLRGLLAKIMESTNMQTPSCESCKKAGGECYICWLDRALW